MEDKKPNPQNKKRVTMRRILMGAGIGIVVIACVAYYLTSGRYIATDNAYIKAAKILITPQVSGTITSVSVTDNQLVTAGETLFVIDQKAYKIAVDEAQAELESAYTEIEQLKAQYRQKLEDIERAEIDAKFNEEEYQRRVSLVKKGSIAKSEFNQIKRQRDMGVKAVSSLQEEVNSILAALTGDPDIKTEDHPLYQKSLAALNEAKLNLERTKVKALANGIIGTAPHVGDYARAGTPLLNLIETDTVWIEANYKETQLTDVKIGQPVSIEIDTYPDQEWQGRVESVSPATGAEFSVLPAQNATGNWVKVVQRIAVRIALNSDEASKDFPLRTGMSTHVTIDTGHYPHRIGDVEG